MLNLVAIDGDNWHHQLDMVYKQEKLTKATTCAQSYSTKAITLSFTDWSDPVTRRVDYIIIYIYHRLQHTQLNTTEQNKIIHDLIQKNDIT